MHAHGVFYDKASEGAPYADGTTTAEKADDAVAPGRTYTYTWKVPERSGPGSSDPASTEVDIHTPHWHGVDLLENGRRVDITEIFPASAKTLDMVTDDPGTWMYHCHVNDHLDAGMQAIFTVEPTA